MKDEHGWAVSVWNDGKGIRIGRGPMSNAIQFELLLSSDKSGLESYTGEKIEDLFHPCQDDDGETVNIMWWTLFDKQDLRVFVKRLQFMLETEEELDRYEAGKGLPGVGFSGEFGK